MSAPVRPLGERLACIKGAKTELQKVMFVAFAVRTEPELEFFQILFYQTQPESEAAVERLCEQFADDPPAEMDWVNLPDDPVPSTEQMADPNYIRDVRERIIAAYFGDPQWLAEFTTVTDSGITHPESPAA